jgi:hypothetical protein
VTNSQQNSIQLTAPSLSERLRDLEINEPPVGVVEGKIRIAFRTNDEWRLLIEDVVAADG